MNDDYKSWKFAGIYKITNLVNHKIYIGQSIELSKRIQNHIYSINNINDIHHLYYSIRKYGLDSFTVEILEKIDNINLLDERESYYIKFYNSYDDEIGYNICQYGNSPRGRKVSDETKRKLSKANTGHKVSNETRQKLSKILTGKKKSEEHKKKLSDANMGHKMPNEMKEILLKVNTGKTMSDETKKKISKANIGKNKSLETKQKMSAWQIGRTLPDETKEKLKNANIGRKHTLESRNKMSVSKYKKVFQLDINSNKILNKYNSIIEASIIMNINKNTISRCCRGIGKSAGGFKWAYADRPQLIN